MDDHSAIHTTFSLERIYKASIAEVFAAWEDPAAKARWFAGPDSGHKLDFRVGGREINHGKAGAASLSFESFYRDIVAPERIVYTSTLTADARLWTVSLTTVELLPADGGTRLVLTEQGTFLDGLEDPAWRERGTDNLLDALGAELEEQPDGPVREAITTTRNGGPDARS
jgi:uncharacterized protein YndB with AHSA1/START domain